MTCLAIALPFEFEQPAWLWLAALVPVLILASLRSLAGLDPVRRVLALIVRSLLIVLIAFCLARIQRAAGLVASGWHLVYVRPTCLWGQGVRLQQCGPQVIAHLWPTELGMATPSFYGSRTTQLLPVPSFRLYPRSTVRSRMRAWSYSPTLSWQIHIKKS